MARAGTGDVRVGPRHTPHGEECGLSPEGSEPGRTLEDESDGGDEGGGKNSWQAFIVI